MDNAEFDEAEGHWHLRPGSRAGDRDVLEFRVPVPVVPVPKHPFPFLRLPTELQMKILSYLLPSNKVLEVPENIHSSNGATGLNNEKYGRWVDYWNPGDICQVSILQASRYLYKLGKDVLYGRTLRIHVWENGIDFLDEQIQVYELPSWFRYDYFRKLSIQVHPTDFTYYEEELRENFLGVCVFIANNVDLIEDLEIEFMGETWDPEDLFRRCIDSGCRNDLVIWREREEVDYRYSEADIVAWMLGPIAQIQNVNRFSIRLPASVATNTSLRELAERYRKVALGIDRFRHDEQMWIDDYEAYIRLRGHFPVEPRYCRRNVPGESLRKRHYRKNCFCWTPSPAEKVLEEVVAFRVEVEGGMGLDEYVSKICGVNPGNRKECSNETSISSNVP
ncbi:MAG: hypothetical protein LQ342_005078 [Letrouitia transgressa]|nr:MAG: hypothetical protein LQ342_005078 [Letrouitia transgressa]